MILVDFMYILNGVSFNIFCPDNQQLPCFKIDDSTCKENTAMKIMYWMTWMNISLFFNILLRWISMHQVTDGWFIIYTGDHKFHEGKSNTLGLQARH